MIYVLAGVFLVGVVLLVIGADAMVLGMTVALFDFHDGDREASDGE